MMKPYFETELGKLYCGDCLDLMCNISDRSIDMVMADPPYGITACKWDSIIPLEPMWTQLKRVVKPNGAMVLFGNEPFSSALRMSNIKNYKYDWIWLKNQPTGIASAKYMPMKNHEIISVFYLTLPIYNKQPTKSIITDRPLGKSNGRFWNKTNIRTLRMKPKKNDSNNILKENVNPRTVIEFKVAPNSKGKFHPTQKPIALMEYLIKTYTNNGETVLDFCMGSGTTAIACEKLNRRWIGIEISEEYCEIAKQRIINETRQQKIPGF